jgi:NADP-dependent 3-hydroxy acid dehydrogenase YdfG
VTGRLDGRRILVTGASSGIGRAVAVAAAAEGARLALVARRAEALDELAGSVDAEAVVVPADVADRAQATAAVADAAERLGGLDAVVNSAGIVVTGGVRDTDPAEWQRMFDVNVVGLLAVTHAAIPHLVAAEVGDIVNVSSMSGRRRASVALGVYSGTKHAVHVVSDSLREELREDGVRVTIVSPGFVDTPIFDDVADPEVRASYQRAVAEQGLAPEVVAAQVVHALAQPAGVDLLEIALLSTEQ